MNYEWDPQKASANRKKHNIDFADAVGVFEDPLAITISDDRHDEPRLVTMGLDLTGRLVVVAYAWRAENLRITSAREARPNERRRYEG